MIVRGLRRHRASGKRIFVLLGLCSAAIAFCLSFRDSFTLRYRDLSSTMTEPPRLDRLAAVLDLAWSDGPIVAYAEAKFRRGRGTGYYVGGMGAFESLGGGEAWVLRALFGRYLVASLSCLACLDSAFLVVVPSLSWEPERGVSIDLSWTWRGGLDDSPPGEGPFLTEGNSLALTVSTGRGF